MVQPCWARGTYKTFRRENRKERRFSGRVRVFFSSASSWAGRDVSRAANGGDSVSLTPYVGGAGGVSGIRRRRALRFQPARRGQFLDRHAGTGGRILGEYFGVFRVDQREIRHVGNEHGGLTTFSMPAPAAARRARMFFRLCSVWAATPSGSLPVARSMPSCPEQYRASPERTAWE